VSRYFRDHRSLGPRERATLAETVYTVLRKKLLFDHFAPSAAARGAPPGHPGLSRAA
jgi:16S rRNA (cytosine967-C5)-methyltransferase